MLHGTRDLPGPGLEPGSPALAGGFLTPAAPGKSLTIFFLKIPFCVSKEKNEVENQLVVLEKDAVVGFRTCPCKQGGSAGPGHVTQK